VTTASESIRPFAEEPDRYLPDPAPPSLRILDDRFVLFFGPTRHLNLVSSVRVDADGLAALVDEIRELARPGRRRVAWVVGPSCRPGNLRVRLAALGLIPAETPPFEPAVTAMALTEPPETGPTDNVEVRMIRSRADYVVSDEIMSSGFGVSEDEHAALVASGDERYAAYLEREDYVRFLALVDGQPVAAAGANACEQGLFLGGAATVHGARGQGAYRALVRARWDEAVRRGTPALVIQAGSMSGPILERVGFEPLCQLTVLLDPATGG
jgi:hypothetical protein